MDHPPRHFQVLDLLDDSVDKLCLDGSVCWLCTNKRRAYVCHWCLRKGDFCSKRDYTKQEAKWVSSKKAIQIGGSPHQQLSQADQAVYLGQVRFIDRKMQMIKLEATKIDVLSLVEKHLDIIHRKMRLVEIQDAKKRQVSCMKKRILMEEEDVTQSTENIINCRQCSLLHTKRIKKLKLITDDNRKTLEKYSSRIDAKTRELERVREERDILLACHFRGLKQVFPLDEVEIIQSEQEDLSPVTAALVEASVTSYIGGRWIDSGGSPASQRKMVQIVQSRIPLSITGSIFQVLETEVVVASLCSSLDPFEVTNCILPGLAYSAQLTNLLGHFLNLRLPKKVSYRSFLVEDHPGKLKRSYGRLVFNLLHVACHMKIPGEDIEAPYNPVKLLFSILERSPPQANRVIVVSNSLDEYLAYTIDDEESEEDGTDDENEGFASNDWESVTAALPSIAPPSPGSIHVAASLVSSAAAGVASLWRGFAGRY